MTLSRRSLLVAGAASVAALSVPARAAEPFRHRQGAFDITVVSDGHLVLPTDFLTSSAPPEQRAALLAALGQSGPTYQSPTNVTLIRAGGELILVDAGSGDRFMPTAGRLFDNLKAAGIEKSAITKVVFTHGHPDHLWGALDEFDELVLPNAAYYVAAKEWDFWQSADATRGLPAERAGFVTGARRRYEVLKERVRMVKGGDEVVPGLRVLDTPGHTQGHVSLEMDGLIVVGDALTHALISFAHPQWRPAADHVPDQAAATRNRLLDRATGERLHLIGFHLPYPGFGAVVAEGSGYRFVPPA